MKIVETSDNRRYRVWDTNKPDLDHVWFGIRVRVIKGVWTDIRTGNKGFRIEMVRKAASHVVEG
jgi:hypothetical protein